MYLPKRGAIPPYPVQPQTGITPLVITAATIASSIFARIGGMLSWAATIAWVSDSVGDDDETVQPKIEEPLTSAARQYYLTHDMKNWEIVAQGRFTGSRRAAAMKAVEQGRLIIQAPSTSLLDTLAVAKSMAVLFDELRLKEDASKASSGGTSSSPKTSSSTSKSSPAAASTTASWSLPAAPKTATAQAGATQGKSSAWPWVLGLGAAAAGVWWWRRRSS